MMLLMTEQVGIHFGGLTAVAGVDVQVRAGETLGLIGPNGSGKSTFFNLITGIYPPTSGKIYFQGKNIAGLAPCDIAEKGISRTFQNSRLFSQLSVTDNIIVGMNHRERPNLFESLFRRGKVQRQLEEYLQEATELMRYFSEELINQRYKRVKDLALADKKRVEICRAMASQPRLLLLDEPSAGMNWEETSELMKDIAKAREKDPGMSMILIEHDMRVIKEIAERVVVLNYGEKIFEGTFEEASRDQGVRQAYLGTGK